MGLSSNTLVHLTSEKNSLVGILKEGFKVKYCNEKILTKDGVISSAFPMISFSDIPLSELSTHLESYGNYGIGLKKSWAKENGLNPVLYFDDSSILGAQIRSTFKEVNERIKKKELQSDSFEIAINIFSYSKNYEGTLKTSKITKENYRFSDEREWRYVPSKQELQNAKRFIALSNYSTSEQKKDANNTLSHIRLKFKADDINYIFVKDEDEISEFINIIRESHGKESFGSVERLMSRIITTDQIKTDI